MLLLGNVKSNPSSSKQEPCGVLPGAKMKLQMGSPVALGWSILIWRLTYLVTWNIQYIFVIKTICAFEIFRKAIVTLTHINSIRTEVFWEKFRNCLKKKIDLASIWAADVAPKIQMSEENLDLASIWAADVINFTVCHMVIRQWLHDGDMSRQVYAKTCLCWPEHGAGIV
jgi:hypothetical protein